MICTMCHVDKPTTDFVYRKDRGKYQAYCKSCKQARDREWALANPTNRRLSKTKCDYKTRATNSLTKMKDRLRRESRHYMNKSDTDFNPTIGLKPSEFKDYIAKQFYPNPTTGEPMTWDNRGNGPGTWQIDHITNLASAKSEAEMIAIAYYLNLRPLWWDEHLAKSNTERKHQ